MTVHDTYVYACLLLKCVIYITVLSVMVAVLLRAGTMYLKSMHHHDVHEVSIFPSIQYIVFTLIIIVIIIITVQHNFIKLQSA